MTPRAQQTSPGNGAHAAAEAQPLQPEPASCPSGDLSRRTFLKAAGFTFGGLAAAGCSRAPVKKAIPYLVQPEEITPGRPAYYASTCAACSAGCGLLVTVRDGRPIKLEGNPAHPLSRGGLCAVGQASILGAYDSQRLESPHAKGQPASWVEIDRQIRHRLDQIRRDGKPVRFLTGTVTSPTMSATIARFLDGFKDTRHVSYDPLSCSAILDAHQRTHGVRVLPRYRLERAELIVSFDADFLGTWISPVEFTAAYRQGRQLDGQSVRLSYHVQIESRLSLTGCKADRRIRVAPDRIPALLEQLAGQLQHGQVSADEPWIGELARRLLAARGRSLVLCGSNRITDQLLCNAINQQLGNYGYTLDLERPSYQCAGHDAEVRQLISEILDGSVAALFIHGVNPVYTLPEGLQLADAIRRIPLSVSFAPRIDETAECVEFICPDHHPLESWSDAEAVDGLLSIAQPTLAPMGDTRAVLESLAAWMGEAKTAYQLVREHWQKVIFPRARSADSFADFWNRTVHDGYVQVTPRGVRERAVQTVSTFAAPAAPAAAPQPASGGDLALILYAKPGMLDGAHAWNPWLQEVPDPVTKAAWDNYACLSPATAARLQLGQNQVVHLETDAGHAIELPVLIQPGQADDTVAVALGYGAKASERFANIGPKWLQGRPSVGPNGRVGVNAAPLLAWRDGTLQYAAARVRLAPTGRTRELALTQQYHRLEVPGHLAPTAARRPNVQETTLSALLSHENAEAHAHHPSSDLWPADHVYEGQKWAMAIDLTACTGCSACVIACQVENNIPVVGQDEVRRQREMHWMRIDRYYTGSDDEPNVAFQPMLCQHCDNAPCETVCPVLATVHSEDGLNQQIYNRCVGTRYCANNCPYKVRRFNWFDYPRDDARQNLVLNPDVTVRTRGVMEKCSFCAQRIQAARIEARRLGRPLVDGDVQPACQQTCPAGAIVFGDINDPNSRVRKLAESGRAYRVLEELNVKPSVIYLSLVRNDASESPADHA